MSAWGGSWGTSWGNSWGDVGAVTPPTPTPSPEPPQGGTLLQRGKRHRTQARGTILGRKEYEELVRTLLAKAAEKSAAAVGSEKTPKPTKKAIVAVAKAATVEEAIDLKRIWAETASRIAEIEAIDSRYQKIADDLAAHFAKLVQEREQEDEDEIALLLS